MRRAIFILAAFLSAWSGAVVAHPGHSPAPPPWQGASPWPDRVMATMETDPATSFAVSWRTDASVTETIAQIAPASGDARFDLSADTVSARTEPVDLERLRRDGVELALPWNSGLQPVHYHSVNFTGLKPDTLYAYRVRGAAGAWSEWFHLRTGPASGPVTFLYLGDAQNGILSHWSRTVRAAFQKAPEARFIIHAGDLVNRGSRDLEWAEWFKAVGFIHGMIPAIPVTGNHEYDTLIGAPITIRRTLSILWRPQFRLPEHADLDPALRETVYALRYTPDLHVFALDTDNTGTLAAQAAWLDAQLAASTARWRVVTMHHPIFSSGQGRDNRERRETLLPVFRKHKVDLILQGHDHTYARGSIAPQTPQRVAAGEGEAVDMMFVNSVSGPKQYRFKETRWNEYRPDGVRLDRMAENTQFFQAITVEGDAISYHAYTATGDLYDSFVMRKGPDGVKRVTQGERSTLPERTRANTGAFVDTDDLK